MTDYKNIGESRIRQIQRKRNRKRQIDCEFVVVIALAISGMAILIINW